MAEDGTEHRFPCHTCGSDMRFDPQTGGMKCDHCGAEVALDDSPWDKGGLRELDLHAALRDQLDAGEMEELTVTPCPNCGAQVEFPPDTHATECPFCATPVVTGTGTHRHIKPKGILPFAIEERAARQAMAKWLGRLWFAPNGLKQYARKGRKLTGIYVPYWTFDAQTETDYKGQRGTVYYETRTVSSMVDGKRQTRQQRVQKIRWRNVRGHVSRFFDDVLVLASRSLPKKYTDALAPWDLGELETYQEAFLAGFIAEGYTVDLEEGFQEAGKIMETRIRRDVKFDIGGDRQRITDLSTKVSDETFKHILLPVWLAAYKFRGETYRFVVNGRTGRVQGERPWSIWKISLAVAVGIAIAGLAGWIAAMNQSG